MPFVRVSDDTKRVLHLLQKAIAEPDKPEPPLDVVIARTIWGGNRASEALDEALDGIRKLKLRLSEVTACSLSAFAAVLHTQQTGKPDAAGNVSITWQHVDAAEREHWLHKANSLIAQLTRCQPCSPEDLHNLAADPPAETPEGDAAVHELRRQLANNNSEDSQNNEKVPETRNRAV